jgi:hypothetical protein
VDIGTAARFHVECLRLFLSAFGWRWIRLLSMSRGSLDRSQDNLQEGNNLMLRYDATPQGSLQLEPSPTFGVVQYGCGCGCGAGTNRESPCPGAAVEASGTIFCVCSASGPNFSGSTIRTP